MSVLERFDHITTWSGPFESTTLSWALTALESGKVLFFPSLAFELQAGEHIFLSPEWTDGGVKNISLDPLTGAVHGTAMAPAVRARFIDMMQRYADLTQRFLRALFPSYEGKWELARTSYRPVEIRGRVPLSNKKDDTRLHVDAFPSRPNQGRRILRVFTNVNPHGQSRVWHVGEPFEQFARRFLPALPRPSPGLPLLMYWTGVTKSLRSAYDHTMLGLHDRGKLDDAYQARAPKTRVAFPPGTTWIVYTDQVLHAALEGQFVFEQTFHVDISGLANPDSAPLRILERLIGRHLVKR